MTSRKGVAEKRKLLQVVALSTLFVSAPTYQVFAQGPGGPNGVDISIRAENRVTTDTPFCGIGGGMVGDRLSVDAFMDTAGVVTGMARFEDATGHSTVIDLN